MSQAFAEYDSQYLSSRVRKGLNFLPVSKSQQQSHYNTQHLPESSPPLASQVYDHNHHHRRNESSASAVSSAAASPATSRSSTTTSMSAYPAQRPLSVRETTMKAQEIHLTSDVAEWAHQVHIRQGMLYWWCQCCFPKEAVEPLHIPKAVEKVVTGRRVRINEPSHCYDI